MPNDSSFDGNKYGYDCNYDDLQNSPIWQKHLNNILKSGYKSGRLLDIGCNYGFFLKACEPYFDTYGVDISRYAIKKASQNAAQSNLLLGDVNSGLPYRDNTFDIVTAFDIVEHILNYRFILKEIRRVLTDNGLFLLTTPNRWSMDSIIFGKYYWFKRDKTHVLLFSKDSLVKELSEAGFSGIHVGTIGLLHFLVDVHKAVNSISHRNSEHPSTQRGVINRKRTTLSPSYFRRLIRCINSVSTPCGANLYAHMRKG